MWKPEALIITLSLIVYGFFGYYALDSIHENIHSLSTSTEVVEERINAIERDLKERKETPSQNVIVISINTVSLDQVSSREPDPFLTEQEKDMIATLTMAEAEGESELGQRLVIDTVLNRMDSLYFPETANGVVYQKGQFSCMWNGRYKRCYVKEELRNLVDEELYSRTNKEVVFFTANGYGRYGRRLFREGHHYFCGYT